MTARAAVLLLLATALVAGVLADDKYTTKYDNVDLDNLLKNERLLTRAFACLMDEGGCTPDIAELKKALPDALQSECSKCSEKQKEGAKKVLTFLFKNKPEHFEKLEKKYDTNGVYRAKYSDLAKQEGIKA